MHSGHHMKKTFRQWYSSIEHTDVLLTLGWVALYIKHWQVWHLVVLHLKRCLNYPGSSCHTDIKDEDPSWPNIWLVPPSSFVAHATGGGGPCVNKKSQPKCSFALFWWNLANPQIESEEPFALFLSFLRLIVCKMRKVFLRVSLKNWKLMQIVAKWSFFSTSRANTEKILVWSACSKRISKFWFC